MKTVIYFFLFIIIISCNHKDNNSFEGTWCISKIDVDVTEQKVDSMKITEILFLNYFKDEKPTKIAFSKDSIKLLLNEEVLDAAIYIIENKIDKNTFLIKIENRYEGIMSKLEDGYSLKMDYITYFYKKCDAINN